ncbi:MAG TPA: cyclase family protein [Umezawaea sp.]|nr:cyclase family protein [Umezawaea sp.]
MSGRGTDLTEDQVLDFFTSLSNWGRWGDDDRLGTLNTITDEVRVAAAASIRTGRAVSLSRDVDPRAPDPLASGNSAVQRFTGTNEVEEHFGRPLRFDAVTEFVGIAAHGSNTHVDGLAHYSWDGRNYNGFPASGTTSLGGARDLSVHHAVHGFLTRGVLLDIAALHGVDWLERGQPVTPDDLTAAERRQGVVVRPGDALLVHTGNVARILHEGPDAVGPAARQAGLHASCLPFLRERDVAVLGNDGVQDVQPSGYGPDLTRPVHAVGLVALGLWLIDNVELTELAAVCREEGRWEFFFAALPWRLVGVTSSASNPVAIF